MKRINILLVIGLFLLSAVPALAKGPIETEPAYTIGAGHFDLDGSFDLKWQTKGADEDKYVLLVFNAEPTIGILPMMDLRGRIPVGYNFPKTESDENKSGFALGDIGVGVKYAFLREPDMPLTMSVFTMVTLPNGKASYHMSEGLTKVDITGCVSKTLIHIIMLHANIGAGFAKPEAEGEGWQGGDLRLTSAIVIGFPWTLALFGEVVTKRPLSGDNKVWMSYSNTGLVFSPIPLLRFNFSFLYDLKDSPDMKWGIRAGISFGL